MTDDQSSGSRTANDESPEERAEEPTPQERVAAARQLYAVVKEYLDRPNWTPMEGTLIVSGIHPPPDCVGIPNGGVGLDGRLVSGGGNERFSDARRIWRKWTWRCEDDQESGEVTPTEPKPHKFLIWCDDMHIETDWLRLCRAFYGDSANSSLVDFIPPAIVEYATQSARVIDALTARLVPQDAGATAQTGSAKSLARSPMALPENREYLSTAEFAAVLAVEPQSVRKRYSETGSYHGVRPTKLSSRRVIWPVEAVKRLLNAGSLGE